MGPPELPRLNAHRESECTKLRVASEKGTSKGFLQHATREIETKCPECSLEYRGLNWLKPKSHRGLKQNQARRSTLD
jgi:hypothetical protein